MLNKSVPQQKTLLKQRQSQPIRKEKLLNILILILQIKMKQKLDQNQQQKVKIQEDGHHDQYNQNQQKNATISNFDKIEELRIKTYDMTQELQKLNDFIDEQSSFIENTYDQKGESFLVPVNVWDQIKLQAKNIQNEYEIRYSEWDDLLSNLASDIQKFKKRCKVLQHKIDFAKQKKHTDSELNAQFQRSLKDIDQVYEKNRTQIFSIMDKIENVAVNELVQARHKLNHKYLGNLKLVEREMEEMCDVFSQSGKITVKEFRNSDYNSQRQFELEKTTPRSQLAQQLSQRGRSQPQQRLGVEIINNQNEHITKPNIPRLPIHIINNNNKKEQHQISNRIPPLPPSQQSERDRLNSQRGPHSSRKHSGRGQNQANQYQQLSSRQITSQRSVISAEGQLVVEQCMANPVIQGAVHQQCKFENDLENDFPDAEQTLLFETERLKMFPDEYECLKNMKTDDEKRILAKQYFFMIHEREIKKLIKQERKKRQQNKQIQIQQQQQQNERTHKNKTPRDQNRQSIGSDNEQTIKDSSVSSEVKHNVKRIHSQSSSILNGNMNQTLNNSQISFQQQLPALGTIERNQAFDKQNFKDVQLYELLDVPSEMDFLLKTATEKDIILKIEQELLMKQQLLREERKPLPWTTSDDDESQRSSQISIRKSREFIDKNKKMFNNGAIAIIENRNSKNNDSSMIDGQDESSGSFSPQSSSQIDQSMQKDQLAQSQSEINQSPNQNCCEDDEEEYLELTQTQQMLENQQNNQLWNNSGTINKKQYKKQLQKLEVITEKQSEFSSSMNSNNQVKPQNSHRSLMRNIECRNSEQLGMYRVLSARETPCSKNMDSIINQAVVIFSKNQQDQMGSKSGQRKQENERDKKYKRCKSHRSNFESEVIVPNRFSSHKFNNEQIEQRNLQNNPFQYFNKNEMVQNNNFLSIQMENQREINIVESNQLNFTQLSYQTNDKNDSFQLNIQQYHQYKSKLNQKHNSNSPTLNNQLNVNNGNNNQFSSIQNQFEESRASSFMNESFEDTKDKDKRQLYRSTSEVLIRDCTEMYDLDDLVDLNQIQLPMNQIQIGANNMNPSQLFLEESKADYKSIQLKQSLLFNNRQSSQINQGSGSISQNIMLQSKNPIILNNHQMTANMIQNFLQNQTHNKIQIAQVTRDVTTCKKDIINNQTNGNSGFTLSTFTEDTLSQMFPTQKRTIQILQNFNSNYYTNFAGVLFTLPGGVNTSSGMINGDTNPNNGGVPSIYLQQCSTLPSEPGLSSGNCMTLQGLKSGALQKNSQQTPSNIRILDTSILSKEDSSLIKNLIIKNRSQSHNKKFDLSKIKITKKQIVKTQNSGVSQNLSLIQNGIQSMNKSSLNNSVIHSSNIQHQPIQIKQQQQYQQPSSQQLSLQIKQRKLQQI
ncbi:UNKNOWN [Stylonychia lemnae]|uniref:Uncharacterized protein n=1 Tax=Stylonychia lemnae TaxID=5949 RepID=A0A078AMB0_STYLE|nr:UNKNOWN [Stylonychia lemnae]|eukprot:CDW81983.1 UNKNOWN [Stylonychia lemnae]